MDFLDDDVETAVTVYQFDDSHGSDKEHYYLTRVAQGYHQVVGYVRVMSSKGIDGP